MIAHAIVNTETTIQLLNHGSPELLDHYHAGRVDGDTTFFVKIVEGGVVGVLKARWLEGKNKSHTAYFYKGRRYDKQGRTYVDAESGEQFDGLAHITEAK